MLRGMNRVVFLILLLIGFWGMPFGDPLAAENSASVAAEPEPLDLKAIRTRSWKNQDGLPIEWIECLLQTRDGYLWLGTPEGLIRFDGTRFQILNAANCPVFPSSVCKALAEDVEGSLWVATKKGVVRLQDRQARVFLQKDGLAGDETTGLSASRDGGMWVSTSGGVSYFRGGRWKQFKCSDRDPFIFSVCEDRQGRVWAGSFLGLHRLNQNSGQFERVWTSPSYDPADAESGIVRCISEDRQGRLWLGLDHSVMQMTDEQFIHFRIGPSSPFNRVKEISEDDQGRIWAVIGNTLRLWNGSEFVLMDSKLNLTDLSVTCLRQDRDSSLWVGSRYGGLMQLKPTPLRVYTKKDGLVHNNIRSIVPSREGGLWIASDGGVNRFEHGQFTQLPLDPSIRIPSCRWILETQSGDLWLGMAPTDLVMMRKIPQGFRTTKVAALPGEAVAAWEDRSSNIWVGTKRGFVRHFDRDLLGMGQSDEPNSAFTGGEHWLFLPRELDEILVLWNQFQCSFKTSNNGFKLTVNTNANPSQVIPANMRKAVDLWRSEIPHNRPASDDIRAIVQDRQGAVWFGTASGLSRFENRQFTHFGTEHGLPANSIICLFEDRKGLLWIGTDAGLACFHGSGCVSLSSPQGLPERSVHQVLEDDLGYLWIGCAQGIYRTSRESLEAVVRGQRSSLSWQLLDDTDGMLTSQTSRISQPAACKTADGKLWFPSPQGLVVVDPTKVKERNTALPVHVEMIRAMNQDFFDTVRYEPVLATNSIQVGAGTSPVPPAPRPSRLLLPPGSGHFIEIQYGAIDLSAPEKVRFRYRLEGYDRDWIEAGKRRMAYYTNLRPGPYRFHVKAADKHGRWHDHGAVFEFAVAPYLHQTWFFMGVCALVVIGLSGSLHRYLLNHHRRLHQLQQEYALEQERARIAQDLHDDLGSSLTEISILSEVARSQVATHPRSDDHIVRIARIARQAVDRFSELIWATNPRNDDLDNLLVYLREHAARFLETSLTQVRLDFPDDAAPRHVSASFRRQLLLVMKEALNNAVKHASAQSVSVSVILVDERLRLTVTDDGVGMESAQLQGSCRGLANMRQRIGDLHGTLSIQSAPGMGTQLDISVPLPDDNSA
jgi:ligand-binding sensor domain-containing protein/signal transduction histidine kinase